MLIIFIKEKRKKIGLSYLARKKLKDESDKVYYKEKARIKAYKARLFITFSKIITPSEFLFIYKCKSGRANLIPVK